MRPAPRQLDSVRSGPEHAPVLVLASASTRRQQLLAWLGVSYDVLPAEVDERPLPGEAAVALVLRLAHPQAAAGVAPGPPRPAPARRTVVGGRPGGARHPARGRPPPRE